MGLRDHARHLRDTGEPWLPTLRERLEQAQKAAEEPKPRTARDAERQEFLRRWLELRMAKEKADADAKRKSVREQMSRDPL
jgi:hypothetical protein